MAILDVQLLPAPAGSNAAAPRLLVSFSTCWASRGRLNRMPPMVTKLGCTLCQSALPLAQVHLSPFSSFWSENQKGQSSVPVMFGERAVSLPVGRLQIPLFLVGPFRPHRCSTPLISILGTRTAGTTKSWGTSGLSPVRVLHPADVDAVVSDMQS